MDVITSFRQIPLIKSFEQMIEEYNFNDRHKCDLITSLSRTDYIDKLM